MNDFKNFWNWAGSYVGYRIADLLYSRNGQQLGYFAEGDEVYSCYGGYLGEVRNGDRLITNVKKKLWTRVSVIPSTQKSAPGCSSVGVKQMPINYEDFPTPQDQSI